MELDQQTIDTQTVLQQTAENDQSHSKEDAWHPVKIWIPNRQPDIKFDLEDREVHRSADSALTNSSILHMHSISSEQ
ncbi:hypothetical protein HDU76_010042, partial [Blyttiomyces sp. JEL0837]